MKRNRLPRLSKTKQRQWYGAAWDDLPPAISERIKRLFKATGCLDVYDSPCQFLDVGIQILEQREKQVAGARKLISDIRKLIGDERP